MMIHSILKGNAELENNWSMNTDNHNDTKAEFKRFFLGPITAHCRSRQHCSKQLGLAIVSYSQSFM